MVVFCKEGLGFFFGISFFLSFGQNYFATGQMSFLRIMSLEINLLSSRLLKGSPSFLVRIVYVSRLPIKGFIHILKISRFRRICFPKWNKFDLIII